MLSQRSIGIQTLCLLWQMILITLTLWGWLFIWLGGVFNDDTLLRRYLLYNEFLLVGVLFGAGKMQEVHGPHKEWVLASRRSARQALAGLFCVLLVVFALKDGAISRSFLLTYTPWLYLTLLFTNFRLPRTLGRWAFSGARQERVALAGTIEQASRLKPWLEGKSLLGLRTVGIVCPQMETRTATPFPVLGTLDQIREILHQRSITQLIVLDLTLGSVWLRRLTQLTEEGAIRLLALHDLRDYFNHTTTTFEDDGVRFISLREEPLESPANRLVKRLLDLFVALPVVVLILPFTSILVWLIQRWQSPGPVFYLQSRTGMMNRPFGIYKYRTMHLHHGEEARQ